MNDRHPEHDTQAERLLQLAEEAVRTGMRLAGRVFTRAATVALDAMRAAAPEPSPEPPRPPSSGSDNEDPWSEEAWRATAPGGAASPSSPAPKKPANSKPANSKTAARRWTASEDDRLVAMWRDGVGQKEIAQRLRRTQSSVKSRVRMLRRDGVVEARKPGQRPAPARTAVDET